MTPIFTVSQGTPSDTLVHCFLQHMLIDCMNPPRTIKAKNNVSYQTSFDNFIIPTDCPSNAIPVIVSFQKHTYGNFAIVRNLQIKENSK